MKFSYDHKGHAYDIILRTVHIVFYQKKAVLSLVKINVDTGDKISSVFDIKFNDIETKTTKELFDAVVQKHFTTIVLDGKLPIPGDVLPDVDFSREI